MKTMQRWLPLCGVVIFLALTCGALNAWADAEAIPSSVVLDRFSEVPVEMTTGELKYYCRPEFFIKSRGLNMEVTRNYRSDRNEKGAFGYGWNWNQRMRGQALVNG